MTIVAVAIIIAAAGIHATWNLLTKELEGGAESVWLFTLVATLAYAPAAVAVAMYTSFNPDGRQWIVLIGTGILQGIYFVLLRRGYAVGDLSMVYPLARGTGPLMATLLAVLLLGERPSPLTVAGALVVSCGTLLFLRPVEGSNRSAALVYGLMTGMIIGCYTVWDGYAVGKLAVPAVILGWAADAGRMICLTPVALRRRSAMRRTWRNSKWRVIVIGIFSTASYMMVLSAMAIAPVSSIAPAREISIVVGTLFGMLILGEPGGRKRMTAALVVTTGVLMVALG